MPMAMAMAMRSRTRIEYFSWAPRLLPGGRRCGRLARDRLHQDRQRLPERLRTRMVPLVVPDPHHDEGMCGDDQHRLATRPRHMKRVLRHGQRTVTVDPEEATVNRSLVGGPRGRDRADERHEPFRQDPLAV